MRVVWPIAVLSGFLPLLYLFLFHPPWPLLAGFLAVDDPPGPADVLITPAGDSERDLYAAELYRRGLAPKIIMSGCGREAARMAARAVHAGVEEKDIIIEPAAESTYENALFSRQIVLREDFKSGIVVTSPYHMRRSKLVFGRVFRGTGVKLIYCPTTGSGFNADGQCKSETDRRIVKREYIKLIYYWLRYW